MSDYTVRFPPRKGDRYYLPKYSGCRLACCTGLSIQLDLRRNIVCIYPIDSRGRESCAVFIDVPLESIPALVDALERVLGDLRPD